MLAIPVDLTQFKDLISNPVTMAIVISIFIESLPFIKNPKVPDWEKLVFVLAVCLVWSTAVTALGHPGQAVDGAWLYGDVALGLGLMFSTQVYHALANNMPNLQAFVLALFGKTSTTTQTSIDITAQSSQASSPPAGNGTLAPADNKVG